MSVEKEPTKRPHQRPERSSSRPRHLLPPLALTAAVGVMLVLALVLGIRSLTGGQSEEPPGVVFNPTAVQRFGLLEVSDTDVDLGRVPLGQSVDHTFLLRNASTDTVTVIVPETDVEILEGC